MFLAEYCFRASNWRLSRDQERRGVVMRLFDKGSFSPPISGLLDGIIVIVVFLIAFQALVVAALLVDPQIPLRKHFRVTTIAEVPSQVWPADQILRVDSPSATATAEPWAFITFLPSSRAFVAVAGAVSFAWWACLMTILMQLRNVLDGISVATPFPRDNLRRIRRIGWAILGLAATNLAMDAGMAVYMRANLTVADRTAAIPAAMLLHDFPLGTVLAGLAVLILAGIFRVGADLQDEQALTI
jgi:hypothetical protein